MSDRFHIHSTPLPGLKVIERLPRGDSRGYFERVYCDEELVEAGWHGQVRQMNHTFTKKCGTVRGLHYQLPPYNEIKLVSCLRGEVWDIVVDIRSGFPTFLQWHAEKLSADNHRSLLIPHGFAHGFQTLTDNVDLLYCHSAIYAPHAEAGISVHDPRLAISWPLPIVELSHRDQYYQLLADDFEGVKL